jgi:hypothetical protein
MKKLNGEQEPVSDYRPLQVQKRKTDYKSIQRKIKVFSLEFGGSK